MTDGSPHILQPPSSMPELAADQGLEDLGQIIGVYNEVTSKLQRSHEALTAEVVRLQDQLASTDAQLQRSKRLAALGEMAAGIAHEIRNPFVSSEVNNSPREPQFFRFFFRISFEIVYLNSETGAFGFGLNSTEVHVGGEVENRSVVAPSDVGDAFAGDDGVIDQNADRQHHAE